MTIRLACPPGAVRARIRPAAVRQAMHSPANDNGPGAISDGMLHAALRHFACHGMAAAHRAREHAEAALAAEDRQGYRWWLNICRALDARMAASIDVRTQAGHGT